MAEKTTVSVNDIKVESKDGVTVMSAGTLETFDWNPDLPIKILNKDAKVPEYANQYDAGMDFYTSEDTELRPLETVAVPTGIAMLLPKMTELTVRPRSGISLNGCDCLVHRFAYTPEEGERGIYVKEKKYERVIFGTVDRGYTGEIKIIVQNTAEWPVIIPKGTKLAQGVISPIVRAIPRVVTEFDETTERGDKGFGSTDN